jgi:hypothetical protein
MPTLSLPGLCDHDSAPYAATVVAPSSSRSARSEREVGKPTIIREKQSVMNATYTNLDQVRV